MSKYDKEINKLAENAVSSEIYAYPSQVTCNICGYKQYDEETIISYCDEKSETDLIGSYICGACMDCGLFDDEMAEM